MAKCTSEIFLPEFCGSIYGSGFLSSVIDETGASHRDGYQQRHVADFRDRVAMLNRHSDLFIPVRKVVG